MRIWWECTTGDSAVRPLLVGLTWLGGRDLNPDTVVQRSVHGFQGLRSVQFQAVFLATPSVRFGPLCCAPVQRVSPCLTPFEAVEAWVSEVGG